MQQEGGGVDIQLTAFGGVAGVFTGQQEAFAPADQRPLQVQAAGAGVVSCLRAGGLEAALAQPYIPLQVQLRIQLVAGTERTGLQRCLGLSGRQYRHGSAGCAGRQVAAIAEDRQTSLYFSR